MTKKELVLEGKKLGLNLSEKSLKADLESAITNAKKTASKAKPSATRAKGEH